MTRRPTSLKQELFEHLFNHHRMSGLHQATTLAELQNQHRHQHNKNWARTQGHYHLALDGGEPKGWDTGQDVIPIEDLYEELVRIQDHLARVLERHAPPRTEEETLALIRNIGTSAS